MCFSQLLGWKSLLCFRSLLPVGLTLKALCQAPYIWPSPSLIPRAERDIPTCFHTATCIWCEHVSSISSSWIAHIISRSKIQYAFESQSSEPRAFKSRLLTFSRVVCCVLINFFLCVWGLDELRWKQFNFESDKSIISYAIRSELMLNTYIYNIFCENLKTFFLFLQTMITAWKWVKMWFLRSYLTNDQIWMDESVLWTQPDTKLCPKHSTLNNRTDALTRPVRSSRPKKVLCAY